jgi:uncharacterized protein YggT (Ycf19 family)
MKTVESVIYTIFSIIEIFLVFRVLFKVLGANPHNIIAQFIYRTSDPLVSPFEGLFKSINFHYFTLDTNGIIAIIVYSIAGYIILEILNTISRRNRIN